MKSVRTFLFQAIVGTALLLVLLPALRADTFDSNQAAGSSIPDLSISNIVDDLEIGVMDSLPFIALILLVLGIRELFIDRRRVPEEIIEQELPVVIPPPRQVRQRLTVY